MQFGYDEISPDNIIGVRIGYRYVQTNMTNDGKIIRIYDVYTDLEFNTRGRIHTGVEVQGTFLLETIKNILLDSSYALLNLKHDNRFIQKIAELKIMSPFLRDRRIEMKEV